MIGPQVRKARAHARPPLTQQDLSARLEVRGVHIDRAGISKIETGYRAVMDIELTALADALGISILQLLDLGENDA